MGVGVGVSGGTVGTSEGGVLCEGVGGGGVGVGVLRHVCIYKYVCTW